MQLFQEHACVQDRHAPFRSLDERAVCGELPAVLTRVAGPVRTLKWTDSAEEVQTLLQGHVAGDASEPLLIKGAAAHWPAVQKWSLDWLARHHSSERVAVRIAPSLRFTYVERKLLPLFLLLWPPAAAPSLLADAMPLGEFAARMLRGCQLPPLVYPTQEFYYMQTPLWPALLPDVDLVGPPFSAVTCPGKGKPRLDGLTVSQVARLWLSCQGAISPLHYDAATSFLTQVRGRKRLLLWEPGALGMLKMYPALHILRRRARLCPTRAGDLAAHPSFAAAQVIEAMLEPGDVLCFPPRWAHYTESLTLSASVTYRFRPVRPVRARAAQLWAAQRGRCRPCLSARCCWSACGWKAILAS